MVVQTTNLIVIFLSSIFVLKSDLAKEPKKNILRPTMISVDDEDLTSSLQCLVS